MERAFRKFNCVIIFLYFWIVLPRNQSPEIQQFSTFSTLKKLEKPSKGISAITILTFIENCLMR